VRAARTLLGEFRDGTLGRISLESPDALPEEPFESPGDPDDDVSEPPESER